MRSSALITTSVLVCLIAYSPIDWPQNPNQDENVVEVNVVYSGGSINGNTINGSGWFKDGSYTSDNVLGTFTSNNINTTVGQSIGLGSGHGNGGPGWWN